MLCKDETKHQKQITHSQLKQSLIKGNKSLSLESMNNEHKHLGKGVTGQSQTTHDAVETTIFQNVTTWNIHNSQTVNHPHASEHQN